MALDADLPYEQAVSDSTSLDYIFSLFLEMESAKRNANNSVVKEKALSIIHLRNPRNMVAYKDEIIAAYQVSQPTFDVSEEPTIQFDKDEVFISTSQVNKKELIKINVSNKGNKILKIEDVQIACTCLEKVFEDKETSIPPGESRDFNFYFIPNDSGLIHRNIYFFSNSFNDPMKRVTINANVNRN